MRVNFLEKSDFGLFNLIFFTKENEKGEVLENDIVFEDSFAKDFLCLFSLFLLSEERRKRERVGEKSKKKKGCSRSSHSRNY